MFKADDYRLKIKALEETLGEAKYALDIDAISEKLKELKAEQEKPEVWQDLERSAKIGREISSIEGKIASYMKGRKALDDANEIIDLIEETEEEDLVPELDRMMTDAEKDIEEMRIRALLRGKYDGNNALMSLHAGAGGTEACDWTQMLYRMYWRCGEKSGYKVTEIDRLAGDGAGLKSVDFKVEGENAYGYLKAEIGVHRLVRISPFDANKRRQTSFASVEVMPEVDDDGEVEIRDEDIRIDVYRSSGAGGQKVNKTETAIRITHFPTGIVVTCQNERSQFQNKDKALEILRSRLLAQKKAEQQNAINAGRQAQVGTGDRSEKIRTYNFPQDRCTDHRIGLTVHNLDKIMDGGLDQVLDALVLHEQAEKLGQLQE